MSTVVELTHRDQPRRILDEIVANRHALGDLDPPVHVWGEAGALRRDAVIAALCGLEPGERLRVVIGVPRGSGPLNLLSHAEAEAAYATFKAHAQAVPEDMRYIVQPTIWWFDVEEHEPHGILLVDVRVSH